jgi:hypothetical protein
MTRQRIRWAGTTRYEHGGMIRAGVVRNKRSGNPEDVIRLQIRGETVDIDVCIRPDEALAIAAACNAALLEHERAEQ